MQTHQQCTHVPKHHHLTPAHWFQNPAHLSLNLQMLLPIYPSSQGLPKALADAHLPTQKSGHEHQGGSPGRSHLLLRKDSAAGSLGTARDLTSKGRRDLIPSRRGNNGDQMRAHPHPLRCFRPLLGVVILMTEYVSEFPAKFQS